MYFPLYIYLFMYISHFVSLSLDVQQNIKFSIYSPDLFAITCISVYVYLFLYTFLFCLSLF